MSLSIALQSAVGGLQSSKVSLDVIASNVANVNTEGYTRKVANLVTSVVGGEGRGVHVASITRTVNDILLREIRTQQSANGMAGTLSDYHARMQEMFGTLTSDSALGSTLTKFSDALNAAAATPENITLRAKVIDAAIDVTRQITDMAAKIQTLRADADKEITDSLTTINMQVSQIAELNIEINRASTLNQPYGDLLDKRDAALNLIAREMNFASFERDTGSVVLMTGDGRILVDLATQTLTHLPASALDASITYPGGIDGIDLNGIDTTAAITSGRLGGLVRLRDTDLPNLGAELDSIATMLKSEINKLHNAGATSPPVSTLTGTATFAGGGATPFAGTGIVRIAAVNSDGSFAVLPFDYNISATATVGGVVAAINAGLAGFATASLNASNQLVITAVNPGDGIAINENTSAVGGKGFSDYFGLNDFFVGSGTISLASAINVRSDIKTSPLRSSSGTLNNAAPGNITVGVTTAVGPGDGSALQAMNNAFHTPYAFSASGNLSPVTTTLIEYAHQILADSSSRAADAKESLDFNTILLNDIKTKSSTISGVNIDEELANLIVFQASYAAAARVISAANEMMDILERMVG
jgi:flagellar hook-associated protein 1 FlgK